MSKRVLRQASKLKFYFVLLKRNKEAKKKKALIKIFKTKWIVTIEHTR